MGKQISKAVGGIIDPILGFGAQEAAGEAIFRAAQPTAEELAFREARLNSLTRDIARRQETLEQLVPEIQALIGGRESRTLAPLREQQSRQRAQLEQRLRRQLGSGFATTTAGQQALREFERQSQLATAQAQQQTLGQLTQVRGAFGGTPGLGTQQLLGQQRIGLAQLAGQPFAGQISRGKFLGQAGALAAGGAFGKLKPPSLGGIFGPSAGGGRQLPTLAGGGTFGEFGGFGQVA